MLNVNSVLESAPNSLEKNTDILGFNTQDYSKEQIFS